MKVGDVFTIKAQENASTGFTWMLLDEELEFHGLTGVIRQVGSRYEGAKNVPDGMVGVPGTRYIDIEGLAEGSGTLHLILGRPWEVEAAFKKKEVYQPVGDIKIDLSVSANK